MFAGPVAWARRTAAGLCDSLRKRRLPCLIAGSLRLEGAELGCRSRRGVGPHARGTGKALASVDSVWACGGAAIMPPPFNSGQLSLRGAGERGKSKRRIAAHELQTRSRLCLHSPSVPCAPCSHSHRVCRAVTILEPAKHCSASHAPFCIRELRRFLPIWRVLARPVAHFGASRLGQRFGSFVRRAALLSHRRASPPIVGAQPNRTSLDRHRESDPLRLGLEIARAFECGRLNADTHATDPLWKVR